MWIIYALVSAIFSGLTSVLASYSSKLNKVDSILITTIRTFIILVFILDVACGQTPYVKIHFFSFFFDGVCYFIVFMITVRRE